MRKAFLFATVAAIVATSGAATSWAKSPPAPAPRAAAGAAAPDAGPAQDPLSDRQMVDLPPVLGALQTQGTKLTALDSRGGIPGYIGELPDGKVQSFYLTPDGKHVIIGLMYGYEADHWINVTGDAIKDMRTRFEYLKRRAADEDRRAEAARKAADDAHVALDDQQNSADKAAKELGAATITGLNVPPPPPPPAPAPVPAPAPAAAATPSAPSASAAPGDSSGPTATNMAYLSDISKDKFLADVGKIGWFTVGKTDAKAPILYMIADPQCPHCHAVWDKVKDRVRGGELSVMVILVDTLPGSRDQAISILSRPDPGRAFYLGEGSVDGRTVQAPPPSGGPDYARGKFLLDANDAFMNSLPKCHDTVSTGCFRGTPWLSYVGKDGKLYTMSGDEHVEDFLSAL